MKYLLWSALLLQALAPRQDTSINLFSPAQDAAIGRESAQQANRELPLAPEGSVAAYIRAMGVQLGGSSPQSFRYVFRVVNTAGANAETFPGGYVYIDRGLIELTANEHELAGLLAHEIGRAHV